MKILFHRTILSILRLRGVLRLFAMVAALGLASLPFTRVSAAGEFDPPVPQRQIPAERLERIWAHQLRLYERIGDRFDREDRFTERVQSLIDRAEENGKDVSAVQAALDAFEAAVQEARPLYESASGLVHSHQGFDEEGNVTDPQKAQETVQALREKFKEINAAMNGTGKALREAIKAFRESNRRP